MALISTIRRNSWILIVFIALGVGGFILMDTFNSQTGLFAGDATKLAEIEGRKVDIQEFNRAESILYGNASGDPYGRRQFLWNFFVEQTLVEQEADDLGLGVSKQELLDLQFGPDDRLSPIIRSRFQNPQTGLLDRQQLMSFKNQIESNTLDPSLRPFWAMQEKEIIKDRLQSKLVSLVEKAFYTPTWMAEMISADQSTQLDFAFVQVPFDALDNSEVPLSDDDFRAFLQEHKAEYTYDEETRKVAYVAFEVLPTAEDSAKLRQQVAELVQPFAEAEDDSLFVEINYGAISMQWFAPEDISPVIADTVFSIPVGSVYGPFEDAGAYRAVKVLQRQTMPDSAVARHILLTATTEQEFADARRRLDSLKTLIETGAAQFDSLAIQFSQDPGSARRGGELDPVSVNTFVPEFNDAVFFQIPLGQLGIVRTQFGVHLVEPLKRSGEVRQRVRLAFLIQPIIPSEETQEAVRDRALTFVENYRTLEELEQAIAEDGSLSIEVSPPLKRNDYVIGLLGGGTASREIIRWAFGDDPQVSVPEVGDVSPELYSYQDQVEYYTNKYVIAGLKAVQEPGLPSVDYIREDIEPQVINRKKGLMISESIAGQTDLAAIAAAYEDALLDTAQAVTFASAFIPGVGTEPKVVATAFTLDVNQTSQPVIGNTGVFVVKPTFKPAPTQTAQIPQIRRTNQLAARSQVRSRLMQALVKNADIEDRRARFY
ncbi:MAG: hypothetical protein D6765_08650 [Bacteroidetes bacterium]|nr:MAG: hypothetical protein D6765_08650 [Bacteroidota bacterium]